MKKSIISARSLEKRLNCFGCFDLHDTFCVKSCQLNIRCAIARNQDEQLEFFDDFFDLALEPSRLQ